LDEVVKLAFLTQEWSDFKAFRGNHELRWDNPGLNFLCSDNLAERGLTANGCGKSSIFDAWCWCLFGRTPHNLRNTDVSPWGGGGKPIVMNHFTIDGAQHWVERTPGRLICDDKEISQDQLHEMIGFELELAVNAILLAQDKDLFFDLEPKSKLGVFSGALGLERWDNRSAAASELTKVAAAEAELQRSELRSHTQNIEALDGLLTEAKADAEKWAFASRARERDTQGRRELLKARLETQETALGGAKLRLDSAGTEAKSLRAEIMKLTKEEHRAAMAVDKAVNDEGYAKQSLAAVDKELKELAKAKTCPTCGQPIKPANLAKHKAELETKRAAIAALVETGVDPKLRKAQDFYNQKLAQAEAHLRGFEEREEAAEAEVDRRTPEVAQIKAHLAQLAQAVEEVNPYTRTIQDLTAKIKQAHADLHSCKITLEEAERKTERKRYWIKGFRDLKLELITDVLQDFELTTNGMIEEVGLRDWEINYDIEQETKAGTMIRAINVGIKSPSSRKAVRWESWSGGERQRLKLIGTLALSDTLLAAAGIETNLEILDEPASYWSTEGIADMIVFLAERARAQNKSIYLVEHSAVESSHFARTLKIVRDGKGAYIE
jgi:DNA repair exonuclease SbcCD ATPase subunit